MAKQLKKEDITYVHIEKLGGRPSCLISAAGYAWKNKEL
jgi:hypothetical protein